MVESSDVDLILVLRERWGSDYLAETIPGVVMERLFGQPNVEALVEDRSTKKSYLYPGTIWRAHSTDRDESAVHFVHTRVQTHSVGVRFFKFVVRRGQVLIQGPAVAEVDLVPMLVVKTLPGDPPDGLRLGLIRTDLGLYKGELYGELKRKQVELSRPDQFGEEVRVIVRALKRWKKNGGSGAGLRVLSGYSMERAIVAKYGELREDGAQACFTDAGAVNLGLLYERFIACCQYLLHFISVLEEEQQRPPEGFDTWQQVLLQLRGVLVVLFADCRIAENLCEHLSHVAHSSYVKDGGV